MWRRLALAAAALVVAGSAAAGSPWTSEELKTLRGLWIGGLGPPPAEPSNRVADDPAAARLGQMLFSDRGMSANGKVACATCHLPGRGFTDARPVGHGVADGNRRTMPVVQAVWSTWQFWDGRADSLWAQALGPVENPVEHGFTRTEVVRRLAGRYRAPYERLFGPLPDLSDTDRFPVRASPAGDPAARAAWGRMTPEDQRAVDRAFANFGKSIAAYERTLKPRPTQFDGYLSGVFGQPGRRASLSPDAGVGLKLFIGKAQCTRCHNGPMLSHEGFANTGVPPRAGLPADQGRIEGVRKAQADPFNCRGAFSDAPGKGCDELDFVVAGDASQARAYKVPSLRGVARRAPYMHAGQYKTLEQVVDHYSRAPKAVEGTSEITPLNLTADERRQLVAFLETLD
jgi:cytochrome c peroxidase